jgi:HEAT repeat protein
MARPPPPPPAPGAPPASEEARALARARALEALDAARTGEARVQAVDALAALAASDVGARGPEVVARVRELLADPEAGVRAGAATLAAAVLPPEEALDALAGRLEDPEREVRLEAAGRLADMARPEARAALARALEDADGSVRFEGARGMAALQHPAGLAVLEEALGEAALRFRALGALGELGDARALPAVRRLFRKWLLPAFDRTQAAGVLARLGDAEGAAWLLGRLRGRWQPDRALAAELCGEVRLPGARERLLEMVADAKEPARGAAARGLGRLGEAQDVGVLAALLAEGGAPEDLRLDAAEALCLLGTAEARARVRAFLPTLESPEERADLEALLVAAQEEGR